LRAALAAAGVSSATATATSIVLTSTFFPPVEEFRLIRP
jgi:hypothetical protein